VIRLYGVMNARLKDRDFLAGRTSIANMIAGMGCTHQDHGQ